jgi:hypothetical protein
MVESGSIPARQRLESERLQISANLVTIEATRARVQMLKEMGQTDFSSVAAK